MADCQNMQQQFSKPCPLLCHQNIARSELRETILYQKREFYEKSFTNGVVGGGIIRITFILFRRVKAKMSHF